VLPTFTPMRTTSTTGRIARLVAILGVAALVGTACGGSNDDSSSGGTAADKTTKTTEAPISATLDASGSTFTQAFLEEAIAAYKEVQPGVTVNYGGGGSGKGRQELQDGVVDFAGTDGLVKPEDVPKYKGAFVYVPTVAAPITVSYNLTDVKSLKLSADTIAKIFERQIKTWDDAAIKADNPGAKLPSTAITVAHRADGSGTTENFTKFLVAAAPATWTLKSGATVEWPADTQAGNGNQGVASIVKSTAGAIGYVDLSDAKASSLQTATIENKAGKFVAPTLDGAAAAVASAPVNADLTYSPLWADGDAAYPITSPTWIIVYKNQADPAKGKAIKSFLRFLLTDGQDIAPEVDYTKLPASLRTKAMAQVDAIVVP
jgi:phosphate transport system substrate-binding protein